MKLNHLSLFFILSSFIILSCNKNKDDDDGISISDGCSASWKVNGTDYSKDNLTLCLYLDNVLNLSASTTGGDFQLFIDPITTTGTYVGDITNQDLTVIITIRLNDNTLLASENAVVNVTELSSSKAKGTFSGNFFDIMDLNLDPVFSVTNGVFEANF